MNAMKATERHKRFVSRPKMIATTIKTTNSIGVLSGDRVETKRDEEWNGIKEIEDLELLSLSSGVF